MYSIDLKEEEMLEEFDECISEKELTFSKWYLRLAKAIFDFTSSLDLIEEDARKEGNEDVMDWVERFRMWSNTHPFIPVNLGVRNQRNKNRR